MDQSQEGKLDEAVFVKRYKNCDIYKKGKKYLVYNLRERRLLEVELESKADAKELIKML